MLHNLLFFGLNNYVDLWRGWYDTSDPLKMAIITSLVVAAVVGIIFYYLMPVLFKKKRFGMLDYILTWLIDMILTGGIAFLIAFKLVKKYVETMALESSNPGITAIVATPTVDEVYYGLICAGFGFLAFFIVTMILRPFASARTNTIPFGSKGKNAQKVRR